MKRNEFLLMLERLCACEQAKEWFKQSRQSPQKAWERCNKPGWMAWLIWVAIRPEGTEEWEVAFKAARFSFYATPNRLACNKIRELFPNVPTV